MYENLYEPLPDCEAYLNRINSSHPVTPDKASLDALIYDHQCTVPFENLDVSLYKKEINLGISDLFNKVVVNKRGGYCFELNAIFYALLKAIGYSVHACMVKVCHEGEMYTPALHRGTIVTLANERYYCDVGFGGPVPAGAMKLEEDTIQDIQGELYRFTKHNENKWYLSRINQSGEEVNLLCINPNSVELEDFVALSHYCSCHTLQDFDFFTSNIIANIRVKEQGHYSLMNNVLTKKINGDSKEILLESDKERKQILNEIFCLNIC